MADRMERLGEAVFVSTCMGATVVVYVVGFLIALPLVLPFAVIGAPFWWWFEIRGRARRGGSR